MLPAHPITNNVQTRPPSHHLDYRLASSSSSPSIINIVVSTTKITVVVNNIMLTPSSSPSSSSSPPYHRHHHCHDHIHRQPRFINVSVITMSLPMTKTNMTSTMITIVSPTTYDPRSYICSHALGLVRTSSCFYCAGRPDRHQHPNRPSNSFRAGHPDPPTTPLTSRCSQTSASCSPSTPATPSASSLLLLPLLPPPLLHLAANAPAHLITIGHRPQPSCSCSIRAFTGAIILVISACNAIRHARSVYQFCRFPMASPSAQNHRIVGMAIPTALHTPTSRRPNSSAAGAKTVTERNRSLC